MNAAAAAACAVHTPHLLLVEAPLPTPLPWALMSPWHSPAALLGAAHPTSAASSPRGCAADVGAPVVAYAPLDRGRADVRDMLLDPRQTGADRRQGFHSIGVEEEADRRSLRRQAVARHGRGGNLKGRAMEGQRGTLRGVVGTVSGGGRGVERGQSARAAARWGRRRRRRGRGWGRRQHAGVVGEEVGQRASDCEGEGDGGRWNRRARVGDREAEPRAERRTDERILKEYSDDKKVTLRVFF